MLDIKFIRDNPEKVKEGCQKKGVKIELDQVLEMDKKRRQLIQEKENLKAEQNKLTAVIPSDSEESRRKQSATGSFTDAQDDKKERAKEIKEKIKKLEPELDNLEKEFANLMTQIPNLPLDDVPVGKDEGANVVLREEDKKPKLNFQAKDYLAIAEKLDLIDIKRAAKVSGSRFGYLKNEAALLEFALIQLAFQTCLKESFIPVVPPVMIKSLMMQAMGYIDSAADKEERYYLPKDDLYLIGTSEQSIGPMHADEVFQEKDLPRRYVGFSTCFRREAGSYGKDTKGILRVHQFDKVEMFSFCRPADSQKEHQFFLKMEEKLMQLLKIHYRIVQVCTGDLAKPSAATYDLEAWLPGQNQYKETHSTSNCTDFQARRLNIRYRRKDGQLDFVHTINGTAYALGRTLIAIIENYQQKDGSLLIPKACQKYIGQDKING